MLFECDTGQNAPRVMLLALEGKMEAFLVCGAAKKLVHLRFDSPFLPHQLRYSMSSILSYHESTAGSALAAVFDWSRNRSVGKLPLSCCSAVSCPIEKNIYSVGLRNDLSNDILVLKATEKWHRSARSNLPFARERLSFGRSIKGSRQEQLQFSRSLLITQFSGNVTFASWQKHFGLSSSHNDVCGVSNRCTSSLRSN